MKDFIFNEDVLGEGHERRVRQVLANRHAVHIAELTRILGTREEEARSAVENLVRSGVAVRLRPYGYAGNAHDCFEAVARSAAEGRPPAAQRENERSTAMSIAKKAASVFAVMAMAVGTASAGDPNKVVVDGSTTVGPIAKAFAEYYMGKHPEVNITVSESGSGNGAKSLINGACDVATMSRPMKNSEKKSAGDAGILPIEHIVAMDGIAVVVHPSNPVGELTIDKIRDIYMGKIRNWKDLGGPDQPIVVITRDTNSGTYETFEGMVMNKEKIVGSAETMGSNGAIRQKIMGTASAIGYVGIAFLEGVKGLKVNGVEPTPETVLDKSYPIARPLFMYTNGRLKEGTAVAGFVGLAWTPAGKKIVEDTGFVPLKD